MDTRFRGILPCITYHVQLQGGRENILAALDRCVTTASWTRYNFIFILFARPRQMFGQIGDDSIHITARGTARNSGQVLLHGRIVSEDEDSCVLRYRLIPNYYALLFDLFTLVFCVACFISMANKNYWIWVVPGLATAFCWLLSVISAVPLNMILNEALKEYLEE